MARDSRPAAPAMIEQLLADPTRFGFLEAVRAVAQANPGAAAVGATEVEKEPIRFRVWPWLSFPAGEIASAAMETGPDGRERVTLTVTFLGLHGSSSPLPSFYPEEIAKALASNDEEDPRRDFLDFFHHRLLSMLVRVVGKYRHETHFIPGAADTTSQRLLALGGLTDRAIAERLRGLRGEDALAGLAILALPYRSPEIVCRALEHCLPDLSFSLREFVPRSVEIPESDRTVLGRRAARLGEDALLGARLPDMDGKCAVVIGPLDRDRFRSQLPDRPDYALVRRLIRWLLREPLAFDVVLGLDADAAPSPTLGADEAARLGWSIWLGGAGPGATVTFSDSHAPRPPTHH